uniref:Uncharacterized protein n=1 Tax=Rhizophora mucronata TaxID=61149 RepID=A0A2P2QKU0_RHIMU
MCVCAIWSPFASCLSMMRRKFLIWPSNFVHYGCPVSVN